ncbi:MAG: hypothetical protein U1E17_12485 [Geminicoccaceae bacterium]
MTIPADLLLSRRTGIGASKGGGASGGDGAGPGRRLISLGAPFDQALPWQGLPCGTLHEASGLAAAGLVTALARRCLRHGGSLVWCRDTRLAGELGDLQGLGLARFGLTPARLTIVQACGEAEVAEAFAAAMRQRATACAVAEIARLDLPIGHRLQRAAATGRGVGLILRPEEPDSLPGPALTRWHAEPRPSRHGLVWRLTLLHARGGAPGVWTVRWDERRLAFALAAPTAAGMPAAAEAVSFG